MQYNLLYGVKLSIRQIIPVNNRVNIAQFILFAKLLITNRDYSSMKKTLKRLSLTTLLLNVLVSLHGTSTPISPTQVQRELPGMSDLLQKCAQHNKVPRQEIDRLLDTVIQEELNHPDHYAFYHAQHKNWFFLTECISIIYEWYYQTSLHNFSFLRLPTKDFSIKTSCYDHMITLGINNRWPWPAFDASGKVRKYILSVNCSLVGSMQKPPECTLSYFLSAHSCLKLNPEKIYQILKNWFDEAGIQVPYSVIVQAYEWFEKEFAEIHSGVVYQILMPKDVALQNTYIAIAGGRFQGKGQTSQNAMSTYTHEILEEIISKPNFENNLYQARIHCCNDSILNPQNGTEILAHVLPSQQILFMQKRNLFKKQMHDMLNA